MKRLYSSKRNRCPICSNHHGCAVREDNLIECLRSSSQHDAPQGYRFIKLLRNGMGGLFALSGDRPAEPRHQERQQQASKAAADRAKGALPTPERDKAIRKLHRYFGLGSGHRRDLRDRHLSDVQIDAAPFFSIYPDQELPAGIPGNLPGVTRRGDKLYAKGTGYVCPSFDLEGKVNGWQIRYDNPEAAGGKYKWPVGPHLRSGELPITVCRPVDGIKRPGVCLVEGFLKAYIAAHKLGQIFIGSPNGQFAASKKQTLAALEAYCVDRALTLAPDAGDVCNRQVMQRWDDQIKWLQSQGYTLSVEWWEQVDKSHPDIDELTGDEAKSYISPEEFLALGQQHSGYTKSSSCLDKRSITRDQWELKFGFGQWLSKNIKSILGKAKGFTREPASPLKKPVPPSIVRYPEDALPVPADYEGRELPRIIFKKGKRLEVLVKLRELGWKYLCDRSFTGSGKSHEAGLLHPDPDADNKIWYFDLNHTNPSTEPVETKTNMPPRHNGMVAVEGKFTPKGQPHLKWATKEDDVPVVPSNCHNAELFIKLRSKGWNVDAEHTTVKTSEGDKVSRNPICKGCRFSHKCHKEIGEGYGYLAIRRDAMEDREIRASLESAPNPHGEKSYDYSSDTAFVEEASRYLQGTQALSAWGNEVAQLWGYIERKAPEAFAALQSIRFALQDALEGKFDCIDKGINRGVNHEILIENLPPAGIIANLPNLIFQVEQAMPTIKDVVEEPDSVVGLGGQLRSTGQFVRDTFKAQAAYQTKQNIEALPPNVLVDVLKIWAGLKPGSLRVAGKQLHVTVPFSRHAAILEACNFVVLLDATPNTQYLEKILGDRVLEIEQERPPLSNLTIFNVHMKGMGSNQISDSCKSRQVTLVEWIKQQHQEVKVLANKADSHLPLDGWWFNDNRGSNAFKGVEALIAFNVPRPNLGVIQDEYRTLLGSLEGFEEYYQHLIQSEIVQLIGRPRAHQYLEKQFSLYLTSSNQDLSFLTDLGCQIVNKEAFELTPLAGTPDQITRWKILQAVGQLQDQGAKITQEVIATLIGKSQELVSKIAKDFGGWFRLKKLLLALLGLYRGGNNFTELTEQEQDFINGYLSPVIDTTVEAVVAAETSEDIETEMEVLGTTLKHCAEQLGWKKFLQAIASIPASSQANLLSIVLQAIGAVELVEVAT
jgi:hypothetical protein